MKKTSLYEEHKKLNGKMVDFAGWSLPVMYTTIIKEHNATRISAALFDISHMGEIKISGENSKDFLIKLLPTSLDKLIPGKAMYSCLCNENGGVIDDLFVFMIQENEYLLVVNAATTEKDLDWLKLQNTFNVEINNLTDQLSKIDIQGPNSQKIIKKIFDPGQIEMLERFHFKTIDYNNSDLIISCTGYTAEIGYELFVENSKAIKLWKQLLKAGSEYNIVAAGLGARDSLRLEACYSLYGHELSEKITPIEAGLGWIINSDKEYIGKTILCEQKAKGPTRKLVAFELTEKGVPRENYKINIENKEIGYCTSGGYSPTFNKGIGLALIDKEYAVIGEKVDIIIRNKKIAAQIVKKPFYKGHFSEQPVKKNQFIKI